MLCMGGKLKEFIRRRKWRVKIKTWMLIVAVLVLLPIDATLLRFDHIRMTELRNEVLSIDAEISNEESDEETQISDEKLADALIKLKEFVFSNIIVNVVEENGVQELIFGTGPFYLEHQYLRAATKALSEAESMVASDNNPHGNIYAAAGEYCRGQAYANGWSWNSAGYINCMMGEINKYPASDELSNEIVAKLPSTELYRKNYASPVWAPTFTGWMILVTIILIVVILIRLIIWIVLRLSLFFM